MKLELLIRFDGEQSDEGRLDLFEAAESMSGAARVINFIVQAFSNKNQVKSKISDPGQHASTYKGPAKKGCFEETVEIEFSDVVVDRIGHSVVKNNFYDYFAYTVALATDQEYEPKTPYVTRLADSASTPFEELASIMDGPLISLHRPIAGKNATTITFARLREVDLITLDEATLAYVNTSEQWEEVEHFVGNVTKYNILTGYGRAYIDSLRRTVPFHISQFDQNMRTRQAATASMDEKQKFMDGKRKFVGHRVVNSRDKVKRLVINEINPVL